MNCLWYLFFSDFELSLLFDLLSVELPASFWSSLRLAALELLLSLPAEESSLSSLPAWLEEDDEDEEDEFFFALLVDDCEELELLFLVLLVFLPPQPVSMVRVISAARTKAPTFCHLVFLLLPVINRALPFKIWPFGVSPPAIMILPGSS